MKYSALAPLIEFKDVSKSFGSVRANTEVCFAIQPGTIHGIIGENGAGKSTLMKMLFGLYQPDDGQILIRGLPTEINSPSSASALGIGMVHQHFMLASPFSVLDNIILGQENCSCLWPIQRKKLKKELQELMRPLGLQIDLEAPIESLPVGKQQKIEILKLLYRQCEILILDEPTAVLTPPEIIEFFAQLRALKDQGKTILIITHKLKEIIQLTDQVTVMRQGRALETLKTAETTSQHLAKIMMGSELVSNKSFKSENPQTALRVEVKDLSYQNILTNITFNVAAGEVVGFAGVEGNGQMELLRALCYPQTCSAEELQGFVQILETPSISSQQVHLDTASIRQLGVGIFPEDRLRYGVITEMPAYENFALGYQRHRLFSSWGWLKTKVIKKNYVTAMKAFDIRPQLSHLPLKNFSGGNQQKIVVAREVRAQPQLIVAIHPTRGVDIGAIQIIYGELLKAKAQGSGVILISSELDELLELADRLFVLYKGQIVAEFDRSQFDEQKIGVAMGGGR